MSKYPSQESRTYKPVDRETYELFANWCKARDLPIKDTMDELMKMCIEGELDVLQRMEIRLAE